MVIIEGQLFSLIDNAKRTFNNEVFSCHSQSSITSNWDNKNTEIWNAVNNVVTEQPHSSEVMDIYASK